MALPEYLKKVLRPILPRGLEEEWGITPKPMKFPVAREVIERITKVKIPVGPEVRMSQAQAFRIFGDPKAPPEINKMAADVIAETAPFMSAGLQQVVKGQIPTAIKNAYKSPAFREHFNYFKSITAPRKFVPPAKVPIEKAVEKGIAIRVTKAGKPVPAVRRAGTYVPEDFATYKKFKDIKPGPAGGTKDITRMIQEIDGALPVKELARLRSQAGPTSKYVLWRTRDIMKQSIRWQTEMVEKLNKLKGGIRKNSNSAKLANKLLEKISSGDKGRTIDELLKRPGISEVTTDRNVIAFARDARTYFDDLLDMQNAMRGIRRQKLIPKREYYSPHEFQNRSLWERSFGLKKEPADIIRKPELPDYIHPDKPFNPRELARMNRMKEFEKEMDLVTLTENYTRTANRDIFSTSIVQNNKAFIQQLETLRFPNSARALENWTAEAFAGVKAQMDRAINLSPRMANVMRWARQKLVRAVFPLNFVWNLGIQTSSITLTGTRYGWLNTGRSALEWFTSSSVRKDVLKNAYSFIIKSQKVGRISSQDINVGITKAVQLERKPLQKAIDAGSYFTEWVERHLTGLSVRAAYRDGLKRGLKGKALWEYASDGGGKTQSMYNMEDLPGILRSNIVKTAAPFQTFRFEMWNTMKEFAGKTGVPPGTFGERMKWLLRFMAGAYTTAIVAETIGGREPWKADAFIPFYGNFVTPLVSEKTFELVRGLPMPIGIAREVIEGMKDYIGKGSSTRLRKAVVRYGLPFGGVQASRVVEGLSTIANQGMEDSSGKLLFPIVKTKDQLRAIWAGPWETEPGQKYLEKRELK